LETPLAREGGHFAFGFPRFLRMESPPHLNAMGVVHEPVEDAVGQCGIGDLLVPARDRQLRGQDRGADLVTIFADLPEVAALWLQQWSHRPIVDYQNVNASEPGQQIPQAAVGALRGLVLSWSIKRASSPGLVFSSQTNDLALVLCGVFTEGSHLEGCNRQFAPIPR
jgi:hypothetical protein